MRTLFSFNKSIRGNIHSSRLIGIILVAGLIPLSACGTNASAQPRTEQVPISATQPSSVSNNASTKTVATPGSTNSNDQTYASLPSPIDRAQISKGGNVTIQVTWKGPTASNNELQIDVGMDTHSEDLDGIDLSKLATLRNDKGQEFTPIAWEAPQGGHHRKGTLVFPMIADGKTLIEKDTKYVELIIRDVSGVNERVIRWDLKVKS